MAYEGESLTQLLVRLDLAIGKVFTDDAFTERDQQITVSADGRSRLI